MTKNSTKKGTTLGALIGEALKGNGLALPETEEEIEAAEKAIANETVPLPEALEDPWGFLNAKVRLIADLQAIWRYDGKAQP